MARSAPEKLMKRIVNAVETFGSAGRADDLGVMVTACKQIVSSANYGARLPVPLRSMEGPWQAAMVHFVRGGEGFLSGLKQGTSSWFARLRQRFG